MLVDRQVGRFISFGPNEMKERFLNRRKGASKINYQPYLSLQTATFVIVMQMFYLGRSVSDMITVSIIIFIPYDTIC